jgi:phosphatidylinositol alpha-1,6-mannosyltransferase
MTRLLVSEIFPPAHGGSGRWFWELYRRLPCEEYLIAAGEHPRQAEFDRSHDLRVTRLPLALSDCGFFSPRGLRAYLSLARQVAALARAHGVTSLHCGRCVPEGWIAWLVRQVSGLPYLCYAHGEEVERNALGVGGGVMSSRQLRWMAACVLRGTRLVIANSRNTERILREEWGLPAGRVRLLHPGVDTARFTPLPRDPETRRLLGWEGRPVVLTVGRLQKRKGQDVMIRAVGLMRRTVPDVLYAIVGGGEERPALEELVRREGLEGHVRFLGEVDDAVMVRCYQQCDVFVLANRQVGHDIEGFGMVLLEAQSCGKPVIGGASGGTAETMSIPETGYVVPCEQPEQLAAQAAELLLNRERRERMGAAARHWVLERFDWGALSRKARELFLEAARRS